MKRLTFNPFMLVYIVIALATAAHTTWGAAFTMQGPMPVEPLPQLGWILQGLAVAVAVDVTMLLTAAKVRSSGPTGHSLRLWRWRIPLNLYVVTFLFVALVSTYFQVLYSYAHSGPLPPAGGVAAEWQSALQPFINARVVIVPLALPVTALLYTMAGLGKGGEKVRRPAVSERPVRPVVTVERPPLDVPAVPLLDADVSGGQDKKALVRAYLADHPEAWSYSSRRLEALTGVSKSTCNEVLKEHRP